MIHSRAALAALAPPQAGYHPSARRGHSAVGKHKSGDRHVRVKAIA
jgi:hypothetical protein